MPKNVCPIHNSKVIILLTDGQSNTGLDPILAAEQAKKLGIRIYVIGLSGRMTRVERMVGGRSGVDEKTLLKFNRDLNLTYRAGSSRMALKVES